MNYDKASTFLDMAVTMSRLSTCSRRAVGCILLDPYYMIIGSGYNGVPSSVIHCTEEPCSFSRSPHGTTCLAIHAEANAIRQCQKVDKIAMVCTTSFPCFECFKLIANTSCKYIVYKEEYPAHQDMVFRLNVKLQTPIEFWKL